IDCGAVLSHPSSAPCPALGAGLAVDKIIGIGSGRCNWTEITMPRPVDGRAIRAGHGYVRLVGACGTHGRGSRFCRPNRCVRTAPTGEGSMPASPLQAQVGTQTRRMSFDFEDLLACARGELFGEGNAQLPLPPMLMFDRISQIAEEGGEHGKGLVRAELNVKPDLWFFPCHFKGDPVMPGCLGLDALWQLLGFFLGWLGAPGKGRALGLGELKLSGQVLPTMKKVVYGLDIKRVMRSKLVLGIADG